MTTHNLTAGAESEHPRSLLAPYALHSLDPDERDQVQRHLEACAICVVEVQELLETTGVLALSAGQPAPAALWDRIAAATTPAVQARPSSSASGSVPAGAAGGDAVVSLNAARERRRRMRSQPFVWLATGAAASLVVMTPIALRSTRTQQPSLSQVAAQQASVKGARTIELLATDGGKRLGDIVVTPTGTGFLRLNVGELPADKTYQLWTVVDGRALSAGVVGRHPGVVPFPVAPGVVAVALSVEPAGGSMQSVDGPIAVAALT